MRLAVGELQERRVYEEGEGGVGRDLICVMLSPSTLEGQEIVGRTELLLGSRNALPWAQSLRDFRDDRSVLDIYI